jgi:hypothetical protein
MHFRRKTNAARVRYDWTVGITNPRGKTMSHNLFNDQMAWVGSTPWHGLGQCVPPNVTAEAMIKAAGLDWKVRKDPAAGARLDIARGSYDRYLLMP